MDLTRFQRGPVTVVVPDATRPLDLQHVDRLLARLPRATLLVALGLHRPMRDSELRPLLEIATHRGAQLLMHDAHDQDLLRPLNDAKLHHLVLDQPTIVVGLVEPHQYAGYSGGVKTVAIGCAGAETIGRMHGLPLLAQPGTRLGRIDGNPFQAELRRIAAPLELWALQEVPGGSVHWGPVLEAHAAAIAEAADVCFDRRPEPLDAMHLVVPAAKASSFYQASRAATYVALAEHPAIAPGGRIYLEADCPEGLGQGAGERNFGEALRRGRAQLLAELEAQTRVIAGGEQRAYVLAMALAHAEILLVGPRLPELDSFGIVTGASVPTGTPRFDAPFHRVPILQGVS